MQLSVVIPCYNVVSTRGAEVLDACLSAACREALPEHEIVVADSSDDGTPEYIAETYPAVVFIHLAAVRIAGNGEVVPRGH